MQLCQVRQVRTGRAPFEWLDQGWLKLVALLSHAGHLPATHAEKRCFRNAREFVMKQDEFQKGDVAVLKLDVEWDGVVFPVGTECLVVAASHDGA